MACVVEEGWKVMVDEDFDDPPEPSDEPITCQSCGREMFMSASEAAKMARGDISPICVQCWYKAEHNG